MTAQTDLGLYPPDGQEVHKPYRPPDTRNTAVDYPHLTGRPATWADVDAAYREAYARWDIAEANREIGRDTLGHAYEDSADRFAQDADRTAADLVAELEAEATL